MRANVDPMASKDAYAHYSREELIEKLCTYESLAAVPSKRSASQEGLRCVAKKSPDFIHCATRMIALKVSYLGWSYHGLALQEHTTLDTIESRLLQALFKARLIPKPDAKLVRLSKCGRTDKGVSSFCQVFGLVVRSKIVQKQDLDALTWDSGESQLGPFDSQEYLSKLITDRPVRDESLEFSYAALLNNLLPTDIRVLGWSPVAPTFDARFSCIGR